MKNIKRLLVALLLFGWFPNLSFASDPDSLAKKAIMEYLEKVMDDNISTEEILATYYPIILEEGKTEQGQRLLDDLKTKHEELIQELKDKLSTEENWQKNIDIHFYKQGRKWPDEVKGLPFGQNEALRKENAKSFIVYFHSKYLMPAYTINDHFASHLLISKGQSYKTFLPLNKSIFKYPIEEVAGSPEEYEEQQKKKAGKNK